MGYREQLSSYIYNRYAHKRLHPNDALADASAAVDDGG